MTDLISLDEFKEYKAIKNTERDGKFQALISRVSELVEHYCNRRFVKYSGLNPKVEWFDAKTNKVILNEFPVISVSVVNTSVDGGVTQVLLTEAPIDKSGYFVDLEEGSVFTQKPSIKFLDIRDIPFRSLEITYKAGYTLSTLPEDLKLCIMDLVDYYEDEQRTLTKSFLGGSVDNPQPIGNSFPPHIKRILNLYRFSS